MIVEDLPPRKKNPDRKVKRSLTLKEIQMLSDEALIKAQNEAKMKENIKKESEVEKKTRVPLD